MDLQIAGSVDRFFCRSLDRQIAGSVDRWIGRSLDPQIAGSVDLWICRSVDLQIAGSIDRWIGRSMDRQINGSIDRRIVRSLDRLGFTPGMSRILTSKLKFEKPIWICERLRHISRQTGQSAVYTLRCYNCGKQIRCVKFESLFFNVCYALHAPGWALTNKYTPLHGYQILQASKYIALSGV